MDMVVLDWVIVSILVAGFAIGFAKGVIKQAFSLAGVVLGIVFGTILYKPFSGMLQSILNLSDQSARIVAFVIILLVVPLVCGVAGRILSKLVHAVSLGFVDRLLGGAFGLFKVLLIAGLVIKIMDMTGISDDIIKAEEKKQSRLYVPVSNFTGKCLQWTWNKVQESAGDLIPEIPYIMDQTETEDSI